MEGLSGVGGQSGGCKGGGGNAVWGGAGGAEIGRGKGGGRGGATDGHKDEDAWSVAGRDPLNKAKLLEARAAGVRDDFTPAPLAPNRFEALAEEDDQEDVSPADPPGQPGTPFVVGKGGPPDQ